MKLIIDTNVYISAYCFDKQPDTFIQLVDNRDNISVFLCSKIITEISEKFLGGRLEKILKNRFNQTLAELFVQGIIDKVQILEVPKAFEVAVCRDVKDNMLLSLANFSDADYIITGDKDLLVLKEFVTLNNSITKIITVQEFLSQ
jgi:uncharacterized protein